MELVIGLIAGIIFGGLTMCFLVGASRLEKENEIYQQGFRAGQVARMKGEENAKSK